MSETYQAGDVLETIRYDLPYHLLIVRTPATRKDDRYLVLDLILKPSDGDFEEGVYRIPRRALREPQYQAIENNKFYRKVNSIDLSKGKMDLEKLIVNHPDLDQYFRVDRKYF